MKLRYDALFKIGFVMVIMSTVLGVFAHEIFISPKKIEQPHASESYSELPSLNTENLVAMRYQKMMYCFLQGVYCHKDNTLVTKDDFGRSLSGIITKGLLFPVMHMPSSGVGTIQAAFSRAGVIPETYAAGFGNQVLNPFVDIWKQIRNLVYSLLVIIVLVESFGLMFRSQADSKDAISIESYLPKIVAVLIVVQLSFAIAGFMIDLMYIVSAGIFLVLKPLMKDVDVTYHVFISEYLFGKPVDLANLTFRSLLGQTGAFNMGKTILLTVPRDLLYMFGDNVGLITITLIDIYVVKGFFGPLLGGLITGALATLLGNPVGWGLGLGLAVGLALVTVGCVLFFLVLYVTWKVFLTMVKSYLMIIILTIFSPMFILMDLVPGNSFGIKKWIKALVSELVVYPVVFTMLFVMFVLHSVNDTSSKGIGVGLPFVVEVNSGFVFIIGIVALSLLPRMIDQIRNAIDRSMFPDLDKEVRESYKGARGMIDGTVKLGKSAGSTLTTPGRFVWTRGIMPTARWIRSRFP